MWSYLDVVVKRTTTFYRDVSELSAIFNGDEKMPTEKSVRKNSEVFRNILNFAEDPHCKIE